MMEPKFFVLQYSMMTPDIWSMSKFCLITSHDRARVPVKDVSYEEAKAIIALLPNEGVYKHE